MTNFNGQVADGPERLERRWYFSIWNSKANKGISCISSARFESNFQGDSLGVKPGDEVEVIGGIETGYFAFDLLNRGGEILG
jgi:hypothetical protein